MPCEHNKDPKTCVLCRDKTLFRPVGNTAARIGQTPGLGLPGAQNRGPVPPTVHHRGPGLPTGQNRGPALPGANLAPPLPPRSTKGQEHFDAFLKDVKGRTNWFTRSKSSIKGLLDFLEANIGNPKPFAGGSPDAQLNGAIGHCANRRDERIGKYEPAIRALVAVWGSNRLYVEEPKGSLKAAAPSATALSGLARDRATAEALLQKPEMRKIAVMDADTPGYNGSPGAIALCKRMEYDANFNSYKTSHSTLPNTVDKWVGLGTRTKKWGLGNCHQCMAAAFAELKAAPGWSSTIELVRFEAGGKSGHHFLVVGRPKLSVPFGQTTDWGNAFVADLWLQNLGRPGDGKKKDGTEDGEWPNVVKDCRTDNYLLKNLKNIKVDLVWTP
jgi:hypothetical protein